MALCKPVRLLVRIIGQTLPFRWDFTHSRYVNSTIHSNYHHANGTAVYQTTENDSDYTAISFLRRDDLGPTGVMHMETNTVRSSGQLFSWDSNGRFVPRLDNDSDDYGKAFEPREFPEKLMTLSLGQVDKS